MSTHPLFSILIANYNNGKYLMDAINSVRQQTYTNWEIIIVDDCSTDNSREVYQTLEQDPQIHIYYNEQNRGCGYTKRRCAELAQGELCGFLDPDDKLVLTALEKMVDVHVRYPNVSVVYSKAYYCDTDFNIIGEVSLPDFSNGETYFDYRWNGSMQLATYKKSFYDKTEGVDARAYAGVDQDLYFKIEEVGDIYALDEFTYYYVTKGHENSISTNVDTYGRLWYWNLVVRAEAAKRRGFDVHTVMQKDFDKVLENYLSRQIYEKELEIRSSLTYRLGKVIMRPLSWLRCLVHGNE